MIGELGIVDSLYEAAVVPEFWKEVLARFCLVVGVRAGALLTFDPGGGVKTIYTDTYQGVFHDYLARGLQYPNVRPHRALVLHPHKFVTDLDVCTQEELDRDALYREFYRPYGFGWTAGTAVVSPTKDIIAFDTARLATEGPFSTEEISRLDQYWPHFARAGLLAQRLGLQAAHSATEALQTVGLPAASLTAQGRVVSANAMFEALSPRVRFGPFDKLSLADRKADRLLVSALAGLSASNQASVRSIAIPGSDGMPPLVGHLVPVRRNAHDIFTRSAVLLVVTRVIAPDAPLAEILTGLFDLTTAEARVARGIANGLSVEDMATKTEVSRETIRTQLKSVMAKTGTERQTELALLLIGARPIPRPL
ncbi:hypothetical protein CK228_22875 [Mesorhizobium sp. WSM4312]|uniref:helix-turn-helix transcriptional regulator n=1 Tax=Mesorhizobium sp. WSM4312 TaxID=2029411 RepID=UPI000BB00EA1|nr:helix-turn-helix transcriptional regulator [Mesorhizobium sp. WSM4312]PBB66394.1 hypothetical protein CK228_22875 [Mesorhizobium sp. WSM4312]